MTETPAPAQPWDQLPEESNLWYGRFTVYLRMGTERNVLEVYNQWREAHGRKRAKAAGGTWTANTVRYKWHDRASAWDDAERQRMEEAHRKEVDDLFAHALAVTKVGYQKLANRLAGMDPQELEARYVVPQLVTLIQRLEKHFGREPAQKVEVSGPDGGSVKVDVTVRRRVLERAQQLAAQVRAGEIAPEVVAPADDTP